MGKPSREYIYGINPVFEVVLAGRRKIYNTYLNKKSKNNSRIEKLVEVLKKQKIPLEWVSKDRLFELSRAKKHQGVVIKTKPYPYVSFDTILGADRILLLDNIEDPHNAGAILRSAEIFGFHHVALSIKGVPDIYPSVVKVSAGASEYLYISKDKNANIYVKTAKQNGYTVIALDGKGESEIHKLELEISKKIILVIGGEDKSVGQFILNEADYVARIPQQGKINSLNASVAAGVAMYAISQL